MVQAPWAKQQVEILRSGSQGVKSSSPVFTIGNLERSNVILLTQHLHDRSRASSSDLQLMIYPQGTGQDHITIRNAQVLKWTILVYKSDKEWLRVFLCSGSKQQSSSIIHISKTRAVTAFQVLGQHTPSKPTQVDVRAPFPHTSAVRRREVTTRVKQKSSNTNLVSQAGSRDVHDRGCGYTYSFNSAELVHLDEAKTDSPSTA